MGDIDLSKVKILYAEDEEMMRESIAMILRRRSAEVFTASNGLEAFNMFMDKRPDLLITDLQMPVMDGMVLAKKVADEAPGFPILIISAYNDESHNVPQARAAIVKPIKKQDLFQAIMNCLKKPNEEKGPNLPLLCCCALSAISAFSSLPVI